MNLLLFAHPKTGQHYIIWFLGNYQRFVYDKEPMDWGKCLGFSKFEPSTLRQPANELSYSSEMIDFARIEYPYNFNTKVDTFIDSFDKKVYLYRNPYDVMISMYYYFQTELSKIKEINKKITLKGDREFEGYAREKIEGYINHVKESIDHADMVLYYDDLINDPTPLRNIIEFFFGDINEVIFKRALDYSSFKYVAWLEHKLKKELHAKTNEERNEYFVFHARDGRSGQYHEIMSQELIEYIHKKWEELKAKVKFKLK